MSARRGNAPTEWPLSRFSISKQLRQSNLADAAEAWTSATSVVWEEPDDFPDAGAVQHPCKLGECIHGLRPVEEHRLESIGTEISLALRHSGLPSHCPLCFQLLCGDEVRYCLVGDHDWTHKLRADLILMAPTIDGRHSDFPFELAIQRNGEDDSIASGWPVIQSETMFLLSLVRHSSNPLHIYAVTTEPEQLWSLNATSRARLDVESRRSHCVCSKNA